MRLLDRLKGKAFERMGRVSRFRDWLLRNKAPIGSFFMFSWVWSTYSGCPPYFGLVLTPDQCGYVSSGLGMVGSFLVGAGVIDSDYRDRFTQGRVSALEAKEKSKPPDKD